MVVNARTSPKNFGFHLCFVGLSNHDFPQRKIRATGRPRYTTLNLALDTDHLIFSLERR